MHPGCKDRFPQAAAPLLKRALMMGRRRQELYYTSPRISIAETKRLLGQVRCGTREGKQACDVVCMRCRGSTSFHFILLRYGTAPLFSSHFFCGRICPEVSSERGPRRTVQLQASESETDRREPSATAGLRTAIISCCEGGPTDHCGTAHAT